MATTVARLEAVLSADTHRFDRSMDKSQSRMGRMGKAAGVAGLAIAGGLAIAMTKSVKEAMEAEKSQARLEQAFKGAHVSIKPYTKAIEAAGAAAVRLGFDDEDLNDSIGSLIIATGSYKKAQEAANVAMDLARFKGVSLEQATKMLTMAQAGSQRATKQLGISVEPVTAAYDKLKASVGENISASEKADLAAAKLIDKQATAALVIDTVSGKVKGQAQAYSETAAGGMEVFREQMENLEEELGKTLLPAMTRVTAELIVMLGWLQKHPGAVKALVVALGTLATALIAAKVAQIALNLAVLANPYVAATVAVLALAAGLAYLWVQGGKARDIAIALATRISPLGALLLAVNEHVINLGDAFKTVWGWVNKVVGGIKWLIDHIPDIPKLPSLPGIPFRGDARNADFQGGTGPGSISPALYDELSGAQSMGLVLTSGYRPGAITANGTRSDHSIYPSHAIDVAGSASNMARFFRWLIGQTDVKQAFYDPLGSIFGGALSSYREGGHSDHVHVATYDKGGWLKPGLTLAYNGTGANERVGGGGTVNFNFPNYVGSRSELMSWLQNAAQQFKRQNGRTAF